MSPSPADEHAPPYTGPVAHEGHMMAARTLCPADEPCERCYGLILDGVAQGVARYLPDAP